MRALKVEVLDPSGRAWAIRDQSGIIGLALEHAGRLEILDAGGGHVASAALRRGALGEARRALCEHQRLAERAAAREGSA